MFFVKFFYYIETSKSAFTIFSGLQVRINTAELLKSSCNSLYIHFKCYLQITAKQKTNVKKSTVTYALSSSHLGRLKS